MSDADTSPLGGNHQTFSYTVPLLSYLETRTKTEEHARVALQTTLMAIINERDARYSERFESSNTALAAAFSAQKEAVQAALLAADRAVIKAENASEKRFESVNEFRNTLSDQQRTLVSHGEFEITIRSIEEKLASITLALSARAAGNAATDKIIYWLLIAAGVAAGIIGHYLH